jgi:hypothetical protein
VSISFYGTPFGHLSEAEAQGRRDAIDYARHRSRSHGAVIRVYDAAGHVIETHEHAIEFKEW